MRNLLFSFLTLFICVFASAQSKMEILGADELRFGNINGTKVTRLIGHVRMKQDNTFLNCDSAYKFDERNYVEAYSNVVINHEDSLYLYGNELEYDGNTKRAKLKGDARMVEKNFTLVTTDLFFDLKANRADYFNGGKITSSDGSTLTSRNGYYFTRSKEFYFKKDVVLVHPDYTINSDTLRYNSTSKQAYFYGPTTIVSGKDKLYCEDGWYNTATSRASFYKNAAMQSEDNMVFADTLYYDKKTKQGEAFSNVEIRDTSNNLILYGNYAWMNDFEKRSYVTKEALAKQYDKEDTMHITADTLFIFQKTETQPQLLKAYYKTKIYKTDMQAVCDSMIYNTTDSTVTLYRDPILWSGQNQTTADTIILFIRKQQVDSFYLNNNAFMISREAAKHFNQIKGKNMKGRFVKNKMDYLRVFGNGQSIYYAKDDSAVIGVNEIDCSEMEFTFKDNKIYRSNFITQPQAVFHPPKELKPEELRLKGFKWYVSKRPDKSLIKKLMQKKSIHLYKF